MALRDDLQQLPPGIGPEGYHPGNPNQGSFSVIPGADAGSFSWSDDLGNFHQALVQAGRDPNGSTNVDWGNPAVTQLGTPEHRVVNQFLVVGDSGRVSNVEHYEQEIEGVGYPRVILDGTEKAVHENFAITGVDPIPGGLVGLTGESRDVPGWEQHTWQIPADTPEAWADYIRDTIVTAGHPYDSTPPLLDPNLSVQGLQDGKMVFGQNVVALQDNGNTQLFGYDADHMLVPLTEGGQVGGHTRFIPDLNYSGDPEMTQGELNVSPFAVGSFNTTDLVTFHGPDGNYGVAFIPVGIDGTLQAVPLNQREGQPVVADADHDGIPDALDRSTLAFSTVDAQGARVQVDHDRDGNPDELQHSPDGAVAIPNLAPGWHPEHSTLGDSHGVPYLQVAVSDSGNEQVHFTGSAEITPQVINLAPGTEMAQIHAPVMGSDAPDAAEGHAVGVPDGHGFNLEATSGSYHVTGREITADGILGAEVNVTVNAGEIREFGPMVGGVAAADGTGGVFKVNEEGVPVPQELQPDAARPDAAIIVDAAISDAARPDAVVVDPDAAFPVEDAGLPTPDAANQVPDAAMGEDAAGGSHNISQRNDLGVDAAGGAGGSPEVGGQGGQAAGGAEGGMGGAGGFGGVEAVGGQGGQGGMEVGGQGGHGGVAVVPGCEVNEMPETSCDGRDNDCDGFVDNNESGHEAPPLQGEEVITCMGLNGETMEIRLQTECDTAPEGNHEMLVMMRVDGRMVPMSEIDQDRMCQEEMGQGGAGGSGGAGGEAMGGSAGEGGSGGDEVGGTIPEGGSAGEGGHGGTPAEGGTGGDVEGTAGTGGMAVVPSETGGTTEVGVAEKSGGRAGEGGNANTVQPQKGGGCDMGAAGHGAGMGLNAALMMAVALAHLRRGTGRRR